MAESTKNQAFPQVLPECNAVILVGLIGKPLNYRKISNR